MSIQSKQPIRVFTAGLLLAAILFATIPPVANAAPPLQGGMQGYNCTYVVRPGDNLYRIGLKFGVSPYTIAAVNHLANVNYVSAGMVLRVPCGNTPPPPPPPAECRVYSVQRGDWLAGIAARFGVSWQALAAENHISNPSYIYPGMRLVIPCGGGTIPTRTIQLQQPFPNQGICSPVRLSGKVSVTPFEATLTGRVYNATGQIIGTAPVMVTGELGKPGTFNTQFAFDTSKLGAFGRVELVELSAKDGSTVVSASVPIRFVCY